MRGAAVALLFILLVPAVAAEVEGRPDTLDGVDRWVEQRLRDLRIPGAALAVVKDGEIVHARGYGHADSSGRPATAQTPFFVMSVTKSFTALIVLQLVEEGRLGFEDPVRSHLPWFDVADEHAGEITIRHLLTHTSGLPTLMPGEYNRVFAPPRADDLEREIRRLETVPLAAAPGERYVYSNVGFSTLALVIETIEGSPYEDVLERRVFGPLGMTHSHARKADAVADGLAMGHRSWFGFPVAFDWDHSRIGVGGGFTYASAEDLGKFALLHLAGGVHGGRRLVSAEGIASLHAPAAPIPSPDGNKSYAMGWFVEPLDGERRVYHTGAGPNFAANVLLLPEHGLGVAVTTNMNDGVEEAPIFALGPGVASIMLGHEPSPGDAGGGVRQARTFLLGLDGLLLGLATWSGFRLRARSQARRATRSLVGAGFAAAWAALTLYVVPEAIWPMRGLWFALPDVALVLTASGVLGMVLAGLGGAHAVRSWRATRVS